MYMPFEPIVLLSIRTFFVYGASSCRCNVQMKKEIVKLSVSGTLLLLFLSQYSPP